MVMKMREFLCNKLGFVDVETPTLFRRTPGGAREFVVPTKIPGKFYCLPQSPQQFKQLLMVGGIDRYMQIAKCYRDEGAKTDRQPEFTQVDIEMSFVTQEDIMDVIEGLLVNSWPKESGVLKTPFPRMTYEDAMRQYGIDKPDTRFEMKIQEVTDIFQGQSVPVFAKALATPGCSIHALNIKTGQKHLSNKDIEKLQAFAKESEAELNLIPIKMKEDLSLQGSMAKFLSTDTRSRLITHLGMEPGDLVFLSAGETYATCALLGRVRLESTNSFDEEERRKLQDPSALNFLWVYDFPLFLPKEDGTEGLESAHHPFTAPQPGQEELLYTHPEKVQGQHYDLVLNGTEIGGGSIRIHNSQMQRYVLEEILKEDSSQLNHLLQALDSGCPPHGGIALGLDRLVAIACQANSIRDVIAFPKTSVGRDIMSDAPARISAEEQNYYHIKVTDDGT
ncbi:aspartate--tRNA ligase, mitochondrial [Lingula anatina]|uniref:Aspartate--tRNA ligase, mitochondrial n=2 Tax=Lingula anatina TaxID=7574 RepID=A0A1S3J0N2_LINAN|nr:aspartate--tRNA ligase, mitochondrial [Lingula anatina]|eukprot:XP_013404002.1 aspartate--tRNA ligase, mitochondrial [Lingula anatina]